MLKGGGDPEKSLDLAAIGFGPSHMNHRNIIGAQTIRKSWLTAQHKPAECVTLIATIYTLAGCGLDPWTVGCAMSRFAIVGFPLSSSAAKP